MSIEVNKRIDELDEGLPTVGDWIPFRQMGTEITKKFNASLLFVSSQNFEWVSGNDPGYAMNEVVTYSGKWWQSLVSNNLNNIPGADPTKWVEVDKGSNLNFWQASVYVEDEVIVFKQIGSIVYFFRLDPGITRPFNSTNFTTELAAGTWILMHSPEIIQINTSGANISIDMLGLKELAFISSDIIDEDKTITFSGLENAVSLRYWRFELDASHVLTFDSNVMMSDARWNSATKEWTALDAGKYCMVANYDTNSDTWHIERIDGPFT